MVRSVPGSGAFEWHSICVEHTAVYCAYRGNGRYNLSKSRGLVEMAACSSELPSWAGACGGIDCQYCNLSVSGSDAICVLAHMAAVFGGIG